MAEAVPPRFPDAREGLLGRLTAFSDGVLAIAITLLVLNIEVPRPEEGESLREALLDLAPTAFAWVLSFAVIGLFWTVHHRVLSYLRRADMTIVWVNFTFLGAVSLLPFTSDLMGQYGGESVAVALYALNVAAGIFCLGAVGLVARRRDLLRPGFAPPPLLSSSVPCAIFLLSVPIAFIQPHWGQLTWLLMVVSDPIEDRIRRRFFPGAPQA